MNDDDDVIETYGIDEKLMATRAIHQLMVVLASIYEWNLILIRLGQIRHWVPTFQTKPMIWLLGFLLELLFLFELLHCLINVW